MCILLSYSYTRVRGIYICKCAHTPLILSNTHTHTPPTHPHTKPQQPSRRTKKAYVGAVQNEGGGRQTPTHPHTAEEGNQVSQTGNWHV